MLQEDYNTKILGLSNVCVEEIQENAEVTNVFNEWWAAAFCTALINFSSGMPSFMP